MAIDESSFLPLLDINIIKEYDGFIDPDGAFYKVSVKNKHEPTHYDWADKFVLKNTNYVKLLSNPRGSLLYTFSKLKTKQDVLIHFYGYIYYGHDAYSKAPIIIYPDSKINDKFITNNQLNTLFMILKENNEFNYIYSLTEEKKLDDEHEKYVDDFISRQIERKN